MNAARRVGASLYWITPPILCLTLYWYGIKTWFHADDFAWLNHASEVYTFRDFLHSMFAPEAQGTIRPWSERGFFMLFYSLFGLNALPFRICAFLTQFANLALIMAITRRISGSRAAGFLAALLWMANTSLAEVMAWSSAYNQALCAFFLLSAFYFLLRWMETGRRRDWVLQWVMFLLGFGALELNVVYPALAAGFTFLCARKHFLRTLPLFIPSVLFVVLHRMVAPPASGVYAMHFDLSMLTTLQVYWGWMLGASWLATIIPLSRWLVAAYNLTLTVAILGVVVWNARRRNWLLLFLLLWFAALIAPMLPLRDHLTEYYHFLPSIGVAMLGACALVAAWRGAVWSKALAAALAAMYLTVSLPAARMSTRWYYDRAREVRKVVLGVARAHELHPNKVILLEGVDDQTFWKGFVDHSFRLVGAQNVYLTPGAQKLIKPHPELGDPAEFVLPEGAAWWALEHDAAVVYNVREPRLRNITSLYRASMPEAWRSMYPARVDVANPAMVYLLGPGWYNIDINHRWMPRRATVTLAAPQTAGASLHLSGSTASGDAPARITVTADGVTLPGRSLAPGEGFHIALPLPPAPESKVSMEVTIEVDRVLTLPGDARQFGLAFGVIEVK